MSIGNSACAPVSGWRASSAERSAANGVRPRRRRVRDLLGVDLPPSFCLRVPFARSAAGPANWGRRYGQETAPPPLSSSATGSHPFDELLEAQRAQTARAGSGGRSARPRGRGGWRARCSPRSPVRAAAARARPRRGHGVLGGASRRAKAATRATAPRRGSRLRVADADLHGRGRRDEGLDAPPDTACARRLKPVSYSTRT